MSDSYCYPSILLQRQEKNNKEEISPSVLISNTEDFSDVTFSKEIEDKINLLQEKGTQVICYGFSQSDRRSLAEVCASKMKMQFVYIDDLTIKELKSVENVFASSKGPYVIFADSDNPNSLKTFSKYINKKLPKGSKLILGTSNIVKLDKNFIKNFKLVEADLSRGNFYEKILEVCNKKWNIIFNQTEMNTLYKNVLEKFSVFAIGSMYEKVVIEVLKKRISGDTFESDQMKQLFEQEIRNSKCKSIVKNRDTETLDDIIISEGIKKEIKYKILASNRKMEERLGVKINNTYILYGPPGTGKTKIAKIIANELDVKFFSITASDFLAYMLIKVQVR
ncbi:MAG: AAA family ATPase [Wolbachia endosymbiont of Fragariocoptes setiger]|nr:AAA family ATPase [Wolbachia endosymbiont of Fragariocoptes setiger]